MNTLKRGLVSAVMVLSGILMSASASEGEQTEDVAYEHYLTGDPTDVATTTSQGPLPSSSIALRTLDLPHALKARDDPGLERSCPQELKTERA